MKESLSYIAFIEDLLKWLLFTQIVWHKSSDLAVMPEGEVECIRSYCNGLTPYNLLHIGLSIGLINYQTFRKLNEIRAERNKLVHEYWLYNHRGKLHIFRKKLEKLAGVCNLPVGMLNRLIEETSMDLTPEFLDIKTGKNFIVL